MLGTHRAISGNGTAPQRRILLTTTSALLLIAASASQTWAQQVIFEGGVEPGDTASIDGDTDLYVGTTAPARLSILGGAQVTSGWAIVGESSFGEVVIGGEGSLWTSTGRIRTGVQSLGRIFLADQGTAASTDAVIGESARGEAVLTSGASWTVADQFTVGLFAEGDLRIEEGAQITSAQGYVGAGAGGVGTVTVTGAGSRWDMIHSNLSLGNYGTGSMTIEDGATVYALAGVSLGTADAAASGTLVLLGTPGARGALEASTIIAGPGTADLTLDGGILRATRDNSNFFYGFDARQVRLGGGGGFFDTNGHDIGASTELTGAGGLVKQGEGTLTLTGANSYTGGTIIEQGVLRLGNGGTSGSILGDVFTDGTLAFDRSDVVTFAGEVSGTGGVHQIGTGLTVLTADSANLSGLSRVDAGVLAVNGALGGAIEVRGGRLQGVGRVGTTTNGPAGIIAPGNAIGTLTIDGDYIGNGGTLEIETVLGDDSSQTDRLIVTGDTSGTTDLRVINVGGAGAQTDEGIRIVEVGGASNGSFRLLGNYQFHGDAALIQGAYAYRLYQGSTTAPMDGDWYLRSDLRDPVDPVDPTDPTDPTDPVDPTDPTDPTDPVDPTEPEPPVIPIFQPGAPIYEVYGALLQSANRMETLRQRVGSRYWAGTEGGLGPADERRSGAWARIETQHLNVEPDRSTTGAAYRANSWRLQFGHDWLIQPGAAGDLVAGLSAHYGRIDGDVTSDFGKGWIETTGYGVGASLTWYGRDGLYVDGQGRLTWFDSTLGSSTTGNRLVSGNHGFGYALGIEAGKRIALGDNWSATPQAQLTYAAVRYDDFTDPFGAPVSLSKGKDLDLRLGLSMEYEHSWTGAGNDTRNLHVYGIGNLHVGLRPDSRTRLADVELQTRPDRLWGSVGIGGTYDWADGRGAIYGEALLSTGLEDFGRDYDVTGTIGMRWQF